MCSPPYQISPRIRPYLPLPSLKVFKVRSPAFVHFVRNAAATLTIAVFVYPMSEDLGWSRPLIVGASSLAGILSVFISPLSGYLIQKYGSKKPGTI